MTSYIRQEWEPSVPRGPAAGIDTEDPKFDLAIWLGEEGFEQPIDHPMTIPGQSNIPHPAGPDGQSEDRGMNGLMHFVTGSHNCCSLDGISHKLTSR